MMGAGRDGLRVLSKKRLVHLHTKMILIFAFFHMSAHLEAFKGTLVLSK